MIIWDGEKTVDVFKAIDLEKLKQGVLEKDLETLEFYIKLWKKKPKIKLKKLVLQLDALMPSIYTENFDSEKIKTFLEGIKDKTVRQRLCDWVFNSICLRDELFEKYRKRFQKLLEENNLL